MRIANFEISGVLGIAADEGSGWHGLTQRDSRFPGTLPELIAQGADLLRIGRSLRQSPVIELNTVRLLPPVPAPPKILCVGLNYDDHLAESGLKKPDISGNLCAFRDESDRSSSADPAAPRINCTRL